MYARNVSFRLKSNMQSDYTRRLEDEILPMLRKQEGFKDEITLCNPGTADAVSISLWENKKNADDYNNTTYPEVLKTLAKVIVVNFQSWLDPIAAWRFHGGAFRRLDAEGALRAAGYRQLAKPYRVDEGPFFLGRRTLGSLDR